MPNRLSSQELESALHDLADWGYADERGGLIRRTFKFSDFAQAFSFMTRVAVYAEEAGHHPEWSNVYNRVDVTLTTHDADGVTALDLDMATFMQDAWREVCALPAQGETR